MMIWLIAVTLFCIVGGLAMGYFIFLFAKEVWNTRAESRNSTSESELRNPYKRNQWG